MSVRTWNDCIPHVTVLKDGRIEFKTAWEIDYFKDWNDWLTFVPIAQNRNSVFNRYRVRFES